MVSGSKLKCPSKVSWEVSFSLYYSVICGNCLGNVVVGMEKCGKMWKKCGKMWKNALVARFLYTNHVSVNEVLQFFVAVLDAVAIELQEHVPLKGRSSCVSACLGRREGSYVEGLLGEGVLS